MLQFSAYAYRSNPSYSAQGNYSYHTDVYNLKVGNPNIRPSIQYTNNLSYILKSRYVFSFVYQHIDKFMTTDGFMSPNELVMITQPLNINFCSAFALTMSIPVQAIKWWRMQFDIAGTRKQYKADDWNGIQYNIRRMDAQMMFGNYFTVSANRPQIEFILSVYGETSTQNTIHKISPIWYVNAGANWIFAQKQFVLSFMCNDIFQSAQYAYRSVIPEQPQYFKQGFYSRSYSVSLTWKFGNYTGTNYRNAEMGASRTEK